jgi:uncharacterized membrane protein YagU involved in acid resistance
MTRSTRKFLPNAHERKVRTGGHERSRKLVSNRKRSVAGFPQNSGGEGCVWKGVVAGVVSGVVASFVMEQFQAGWSKASEALKSDEEKEQENSGAGNESEPATVKVAQAISRRVTGHDIPDERKEMAAECVHYGMGATSAAVYGALAEAWPAVTSGNGLAFGAGLWLIADETAVPAAGLSPWWRDVPLGSHVYALASHLVYGSVTEIVRKAVRDAL